MNPPPVTLAATLHDPVGRLAPAIERLTEPLRAIFPNIALNISDATVPAVIDAATALGGKIMLHAAGEPIIGRARRDAVQLALGPNPLIYSDFDHMLRWVEHGADDLVRVLAEQPDVDFLVVGRSDAAMAEQPRRQRETERLVNHTHALLTGDLWDLMFAIRRMSPAAAQLIVTQSHLDTLANDVEWPLLARRAGLRLGYARSDALSYRTIEEFGDPADTGDNEALQWIRRLEFAGQFATAMRPFLQP
jgi:hypothetical protein